MSNGPPLVSPHKRYANVFAQTLGSRQICSCGEIGIDDLDRSSVQFTCHLRPIVKPDYRNVYRRAFENPRMVRPGHKNVAGFFDALQNLAAGSAAYSLCCKQAGAFGLAGLYCPLSLIKPVAH